jgi:hypothetical protein
MTPRLKRALVILAISVTLQLVSIYLRERIDPE